MIKFNYKTKFFVFLFIMLFLISSIDAKDQLCSDKSNNVLIQSKVFVKNFLQFLKKNSDYVVAIMIPAGIAFNYYGVRVEDRRKQAQDLINWAKNKNLFLQMFAMGYYRVNEAHLVERLSDTQLRKFITFKRFAYAVKVGIIGGMIYCIYTGCHYVSKNLYVDLEGKVKIGDNTVIVFEKLKDNRQNSKNKK
ncbi:MAG: hypothetical protein WCD44_01805 [Candidatus Babeliales bacterium]